MKLGDFIQNLSGLNFSKFSKLSKFTLFYDQPIWCDVIILDETSFFKIRFLSIKSKILLEFELN